VTFEVVSHTPYPFNLCYCSICRKTAGHGGCAINIMGDFSTLKYTGAEHIKVYQVKRDNGELSPHKRHFCSECASNLWIHCHEYAEYVYPFAGAIDTPLPKPPKKTHLMWGSRASWVDDAKPSDTDAVFDEYPSQGIEQWHKANNLYID
jgi:hypothetical protein